MNSLKRLAYRFHLIKSVSPARLARRIDLDYVEYLEGVASPELAAFARKAYGQDMVQDAKQQRREANQAAKITRGSRP